MDWELVIDEAELAALLPGDYARFAAPVKAGLAVFLRGLPEDRQLEIVAQQAALDPAASLAERLGLLARSCPVLHKLGQVVARDQRLAPELRHHLHALESMPPTLPWRTVARAVELELGAKLHEVKLEQSALAEASVAVVIGFTERRGNRRAGVLKLLKPGIEERLDCELHLLARVGSHLDERCIELGIPALDYREAFHQVREKLAAEVRLREEQRQLAAAAKFYADEPDVVVPGVLTEYCTPRLTAMERMYGVKITDDRSYSPAEKRRIATILARALASQPLLACGDDVLFHCDPHAGNLIHTTDNRVAILDWSLVATPQAKDVETIAQCFIAALTFNARKLAIAIDALAERGQPDMDGLHVIATRRLSLIRRGALPGLSWFVGLLDEATQTAGLRVSPEMMLVRKALLTLEGVLGNLGLSSDQLDALLLQDFLIRFASEWPQRWFSPPWSRDFATRLSNADLWRFAANLPAGAARWATGAFG